MNAVELTNNEIYDLFQGHNNLKGVSDEKGKEKFYEFNQKVIWRIARNIRKLKSFAKELDDHREDLMVSYTGGELRMEPDHPKRSDFLKDIKKFGEEKKPFELFQFKSEDFSLDKKNKIPAEVLFLLAPLITDFDTLGEED